jgi:hypothetical protein
VLTKLKAILSDRKTVIELRQNALIAWSSIALVARQALDQDFLSALIAGLKDRTRDQRGDVGRWMRMTAIAEAGRLFRQQSSPISSADQSLLVTAVTLLWVDRIDMVRMAAYDCVRGVQQGLPEIISAQVGRCAFVLNQ